MSVALGSSRCFGQTPKLAEEDFDALQARQSTENPEGVQFRIRFKNDQTTFHHGELMKIELQFSSDLPDQYIVNNRGYDRSGRLNMDEYHLDRREGVEDPLHEYLSTVGGMMGGGLFSTPQLGEKPVVIEQDINEWFRFGKPGKYRLYVRSPRVGKGKDITDSLSRTNVSWIASNILEFEILPADPGWLSSKLQEAISLIDSTQNGEDQRSGCRLLRFLDSRAAVTEMIRRFNAEDSPCRSEFEFGLVSFSDRSYVIEEMEKRLIAPDQPVTRAYIDTLSRVRLLRDYHPAQQPSAKGEAVDPTVAQEAWRERSKALSKISSDYVGRLADALQAKQNGARAVSISTLLMLNRDSERAGRSTETVELETRIATLIPSVFLSLPAENQGLLLGPYWETVGGPSMLPVLRQLFRNLSDSPNSINDIVLQRILELSPSEGRNLILDAIQSRDKRFRLDVLKRLPDQILPELDEPLAERLEKAERSGGGDDTYLISELVNRYATKAIADRVKKVYEPHAGLWACSIQTALLAYLLRVDPDYGVSAIDQALDMRKETGCFRSLLVELSNRTKDPKLEKLAERRLNDSEPEVVVSAAAVLQQRGSAKTEEALWERLRQWHEQWSGREEELRREPRSDSLLKPQQQIEQSLLSAIMEGTAWVTPPDKLQKLWQLCVSESGCQQVVYKLKGWNTVMSISVDGRTGVVSYAFVAHYQCDSLDALKKKLALFPGGTVFTWGPNVPRGKEQEAIFDELRNYLAGIGMSLTR